MTVATDIRPITFAPGYEVDSLGRVFSTAANWRGTSWRGYGRREVVAVRNPRSGYMLVRLTIDGKRCTFRLNVLVTTVFHGDKPTPRHQSRHLNGDKANNAASNLAWGTPKENADDRERHGTTSRGETCGASILDEVAIRSIRSDHADGASLASLGRKHGVTYQNIACIVKRKTWGHVA